MPAYAGLPGALKRPPDYFPPPPSSLQIPLSFHRGREPSNGPGPHSIAVLPLPLIAASGRRRRCPPTVKRRLKILLVYSSPKTTQNTVRIKPPFSGIFCQAAMGTFKGR